MGIRQAKAPEGNEPFRPLILSKGVSGNPTELLGEVNRLRGEVLGHVKQGKRAPKGLRRALRNAKAAFRGVAVGVDPQFWMGDQKVREDDGLLDGEVPSNPSSSYVGGGAGQSAGSNAPSKANVAEEKWHGPRSVEAGSSAAARATFFRALQARGSERVFYLDGERVKLRIYYADGPEELNYISAEGEYFSITGTRDLEGHTFSIDEPVQAEAAEAVEGLDARNLPAGIDKRDRRNWFNNADLKWGDDIWVNGVKYGFQEYYWASDRLFIEKDGVAKCVQISEWKTTTISLDEPASTEVVDDFVGTTLVYRANHTRFGNFFQNPSMKPGTYLLYKGHGNGEPRVGRFQSYEAFGQDSKVVLTATKDGTGFDGFVDEFSWEVISEQEYNAYMRGEDPRARKGR